MADGYDFSGLTETQQWLLTLQGWTRATAKAGLMLQPSRRTVAKLIERGLVIEREAKYLGWGGEMTVREYEVPLPVHLAWCCSQPEPE